MNGKSLNKILMIESARTNDILNILFGDFTSTEFMDKHHVGRDTTARYIRYHRARIKEEIGHYGILDEIKTKGLYE